MLIVQPSRLAPGAFAFCFLLMLPLDAVHAQVGDFSSLEERMTGREFTAAGLHKLSPAELEALNRWIRERSLATEEARPGSGELPDRPSELPGIDRMAREPFKTRVVGEFTGWTGETVFRLENGMVWRQVGEGTFFIPPVSDPEVTIRPSAIGGWSLSVEGYNSAVRVERIE